jgi:hypothetical protein
MNCKKVRKYLNDHVDGLLSEGLKESVDAHLQHCPGCREELEALRALRQRVRDLQRVSPPPDFLGKVHRRLEREGGEPSRKQPRARFLPVRIPVGIAALATAVIALVFVLNIMKSRIEDRPESAEQTAFREQTPLAEEGRVPPEGDLRAPDSATAPQRAGGRDLEQAKTETDDRASKAQTPAGEKKAPEAGSDIVTAAALDKSAAVPAQAFMESEPLELVLHVAREGVKAPRSSSVESEVPGSEPERREKGMSLLAERKEASKLEDALSSEEAGEALLSGSSILPFIEELTGDLGGSVLSLDHGERTGLPRSITVEIPAAAFEEFFSSLSRAGKLEGEEAIRDEATGPEPVSIRILLIGPQEQ